MALTDREAAIIDNAIPSNQNVNLGTEVKEMQDVGLLYVQFAVTVDATSGLAITIPLDMVVIDIIVECTAANGSGTLTLRKSTTAISDAIICAVDKVIDRAGTIDDAQSTILTTDSINVIANGASDRGKITIIGKRS